MMNSIIKKTLILVTILFSATCIAETNNKLWYAGVTTGIGYIDFNDDNTNSINYKEPKYGLLMGYQLKEWLSIEAEITRHETNRKVYIGPYNHITNSSSSVDFTQQHKYAFIGLRATKYLSGNFGFTTRLGAGYTTYKSNFERESMISVSSAIGMLWRIKSVRLTYELQQIKYPIANNRNQNEVSMNLSLKYRF